MFRTPVLAFLMAATSLPALAQENPVNAESVRAVLMANPEIIVDAMQALQDRQRAAATEAANTRVAENAEALFSTDGIPYVGAAEPDVEIVVFSDYRCPHCASNEAAMNEILRQDDGVRFIQRELPILGPESTVTASYALSVFDLLGLEAYQEVHDRAFARGGRVGIEWIEEDIEANGFDRAAIFSRMQSPEVSEAINANLELAQTMEISGTPFMAVNGIAVSGALDAGSMRRLIAEARQ